MTQAPEPGPGRIIGAAWADPHYPFDLHSAPGPCAICGAPMTTCVHDPNQQEMTIMAGAAKKAAAPKPKPEGTPVAAEDTAVEEQPLAAAPEVDEQVEQPSGDPEVVTTVAATGPAPAEDQPLPSPGITTSLTSPPPEFDPSTPTYDTVLVGADGIQADWYDAVSEALVVFNRTVEQEFRHEGAKRLSRRQMFVRGQMVAKARIAAINATATQG